MRRLIVLALATTSVLLLAGCSPSESDRQDALTEKIEAVDGVQTASVDDVSVVVGAEEGLGSADAEELLTEVRALILGHGDAETFTSISVWFSGPGDRSWIGDWGLGAIDSVDFDQQAAFVAGLADWDGIVGDEAPFDRVQLQATNRENTGVEIKAHEIQDDYAGKDERRAELQERWVASGGSSGQAIRWR